MHKQLSFQKLILFVIASVFVLLILIFYLKMQQANLDAKKFQNDFKNVSEALRDKEDEVDSLTGQLNTALTEISGLNQTVVDKSQQLVQVTQEKSKIIENVSQTIADIEKFEYEINSSTSWFKTNSQLGAEPSDTLNWAQRLDLIKQGLHLCFEVDGFTCNIKTECFNLVNTRVQSFSYNLKGFDVGHIQSLNDFIINNGGDCEDYSFFVKAEWNYVLQKCNESGATNYNIDSMIPKDGYTADADFADKWYFPDMVPYSLGDENVYPNVVCGFFPSVTGGHCEIALTKNKITSIDDLTTDLNTAYVIEPQGGFYVPGDIDFIPYYENSTYFNDNISIEQVITDDDLYLYTNQGWMSYSYFGKILKDGKENLISLQAG